MNILVHRAIHRSFVLVVLFWSSGYLFAQQGVMDFSGARICDLYVPDSLLSTCSRTLELDALYTPTLDVPPLILTQYENEDMPGKDAQTHGVLPDSANAPTYSLGEVIITAMRLPQTSPYTPSSVTVLSQSEIQSMNGTSLADLMSPVTGFFVKEYGATSGLKTISQRGLGAEHTLILLNGFRISSVQNGLTDLGMVPVDEIESVEIVRGGQSASFGADAVAGIVNVVTRPESEQNSIRATSSFGSFGYRRYYVSGGVTSGFDGIRLSYGEEKSDEDFPFRFRNGPQVWNLNRRNADLSARFANLYAGVGIGGQSRLTMYASTYFSERGVGGAVVSPYSSSVARQTDKNHVVQSSLSMGLAEHTTFGCAAQVHVSYERYQDPNLSIGGKFVDSYFKNNDVRIEPHLEVRLGERLKLGLGSELTRTTGEGNSMARGVRRTQFGLSLAGEVVIVKTAGVISDLSLFPTARLDAISLMLPAWSPQIGLLVGFQESNIGILKAVKPTIRSSLSRNFR
ncbi:MAG TPA: hypothetical protein DGH68_03725, partial [Bacteroidetes bacterium]|nr:hypothetical protein [Bacteroidota bacterium]